MRPAEEVTVGRPIAILAEEGASEADIDAAVTEVTAMGDAEPTPAEAAVASLRFVEAGGSRLAYLEAGEASSGPPVVFLHGFGGDHANWALTQAAVAAAGHRTLAFDLPGHGASGKAVGDGSAEAVARILAAGLEALGLTRTVLVAHSFGALVAAALVRGGGLAIGPVVLIAPVGLGPAPNPAYIRGFLAAERKRDMKPALEMLFADPALLGRSIVGDALASLRDEKARAALQRIGAALIDLGAEQRRGTLDLIAPDWHVIWGRRDAIVPFDEDLTTALGGALHLIPGAGHMPQVEKADIVNGIILRLLA